MTAFAFILGCVPLWTATGAGGISRQVLGTCVIGGMTAASILAIFFIPVSFDLVERLAHRGKKKKEEVTGMKVAAA
jgi:HAE1 family hydrophobic/amphiphilic exporter-1